MKRRLAAIVVLLTSGAALASLMTDGDGLADSAIGRPIAITALSVMLFTALLVVLSTFDTRSDAWLRLDWFLPQLRKARPGQTLPYRLTGRSLRAILPQRWLSVHTTKKRGGLRRALRSLGTSWLASPPRRLVLAFCLFGFLVAVFFVCWGEGGGGERAGG